MEGDVKVFHLIAEPVKREFAPGLVVECWGYNGQTPGPLIEANEGDRVRIKVTNKLPEGTTVHWHGIILPNDMDGVAGLTQKSIAPGETFNYEFTLVQNGTYMYHPHADEMIQVGMGLVGMFIIHPKERESPPVDRDFVIMMQEWYIPPGGTRPDPTVMLDFNYFTFNGVVFPKTDPLVVKKGDHVRIRLGNLSMDSHPIHLHGYEFTVTRRGGSRLNPAAQYQENTVNVPVGATRDIEFVADNPGNWAFHCHKSHHMMNGMVHGLPNLIGIDPREIEAKIRKFFPDFMLMGVDGMESMASMHHSMGPLPRNVLPMGSPGPYGPIEGGGMFTVLKVE